MADNHTRPAVRRRVNKTRVVGCFTVLLAIILISGSLISSCNNKDKKTTPVSDHNMVTQTSVQTEPEKKDKYLIYIDPGHGGDDPGSDLGEKRFEKDDNLRYALEVYNELSRRDGIEVMITRTTDENLTTRQRADMANKAGADLYLALHRNHLADSSACGVEVWVKDKPDVADRVLGYKILSKLSKIGIQKDRGTQFGYTSDAQKNFEIIEFTNMTSCIVELGFISNDYDNQLFDKNYKQYAVAIADAAEEMCDEHYLDSQDTKKESSDTEKDSPVTTKDSPDITKKSS